MTNFQTLWNNHPTIKGFDCPCQVHEVSAYESQCAIRMGVCLTASGIDLAQLKNLHMCPHHDRKEGHVLRAEEVAKSLAAPMFKKFGIGKIKHVVPKGFQKEIDGKTGIVFFKDYWQREQNGKKEPFRNRSGDHIDLWNGSRITDWTSWMRIQMGIVISGYWSNFEDSREIWFFPVA